MSIKNYITESFNDSINESGTFISATKDGGKPIISNFNERKTVEKYEKMFENFLDSSYDLEYYLTKGMGVKRNKKDNSDEIKQLEKAFIVIREQQDNLFNLLEEFDNYIKNGGKI